MSKLQIIQLGGAGNVTQNMYLYIYEDEIMVVDCGIGFPDIQMPGADILIPDTRYLHELISEGKHIAGMLLTHGHDDHIAATPYILPELEQNFTIYGSRLTIGFAQNRFRDGQVEWPTEVVQDKKWVKIGQHFEIMPVAVPHSVPDTKHFFIRTPEGMIYHGTDFKLDKSPVDGVKADEATMAEVAKEGVLCMLVDCLRVERDDWVPSESTTGPAIEAEMASTKGVAYVTLMSSHLHRIQQTIDAAKKHNRKVAFVGRSVEQNMKVALDLGFVHADKSQIVDKKDMDNVRDSELCVIIAGSQGQEGSSLVRAVFGEHRDIQIKENDKVIFSADAIPGNEVPYYQAVDELARNGVTVVYPAINENLHQSGHAGRQEQKHLVELIKPKYVMPIGGADRHRVKFIEFVAEPAGYSKDAVLIPTHGQVMAFENNEARVDEQISIIPRIVDGLGIGDVGPKVLSDRKSLGQAGIIVVLVPQARRGYDLQGIQIISRGFVFMQQADEVVSFIKEEVAKLLKSSGNTKESQLKRKVERILSRRLYKIIKREPLIVVEFI